MSRVPPVGVASPTAAPSREVSCLDAHKREETSRSLRRSRIMRDKTGGLCIPSGDFNRCVLLPSRFKSEDFLLRP